MRREERVTVQGPVKEQQPDGMSHRLGGVGRGARALHLSFALHLSQGYRHLRPRLHTLHGVQSVPAPPSHPLTVGTVGVWGHPVCVVADPPPQNALCIVMALLDLSVERSPKRKCARNPGRPSNPGLSTAWPHVVPPKAHPLRLYKWPPFHSDAVHRPPSASLPPSSPTSVCLSACALS